ncbi:MAG: hypothetical protein HDT16_03535 [Oscillibacter sp.]|nr:hypothetical protein [Oscillibacter sp.]
MIPLTDNLVMISDGRCYIVGIPREGRGKGVELQNPTYYATAHQAALGALERSLRKGVADGRITTLREFIDEQYRQRAEMEKLLAPLIAMGAAGRGWGGPTEQSGRVSIPPEEKGG